MKTLGLMTVAEAADYLNVPRPTLYQHLREGNIPGIQIGGRWRIELSKLNEFIGKAKRSTPDNASRTFDSVEHTETPAIPLGEPTTRRPARMLQTEYHETPDAQVAALRAENERLRGLVADQLLEIAQLKKTKAALVSH